MKRVMKIDPSVDYGRCTCLDFDYEEHVCPYAQDVDNEERTCTCCPYCTQICIDDI